MLMIYSYSQNNVQLFKLQSVTETVLLLKINTIHNKSLFPLQ